MESDPPKFHRTNRRLMAVIFIAMITVPAFTLYEMSYNSVNGTHPEILSGSRGFGNYCTTTFYLNVTVWSWAATLGTQVDNPTFLLSVNGYGFGSELAPTGAFGPYTSISYPLTFNLRDCNVSQVLASTNTYNVQLQMTANVGAGIISNQITRSDSATWTLS